MTLLPTALEEAAKAVEAAEFGYSLKLTSLIDGVSTYTLTYSDMSEPLSFSNTDAAYLHIADRKRKVQPTAAITAYLAQAEKEGWVMVPAVPLACLRETDRKIRSVQNRGSDTTERLIQIECLLAWPNVQGLLAAAQNGGE